MAEEYKNKENFAFVEINRVSQNQYFTQVKEAVGEEPTVVFMKPKKGRVMNASHVEPILNSLVKFTESLKKSFEELEAGQGRFNKLGEFPEIRETEQTSDL